MRLNGIIADVSEDKTTGSFETTQIVARLRAGDVRALARAVSMVEDGVAGAGELVAGLPASLLRVRCGLG